MDGSGKRGDSASGQSKKRKRKKPHKKARLEKRRLREEALPTPVTQPTVPASAPALLQPQDNGDKSESSSGSSPPLPSTPTPLDRKIAPLRRRAVNIRPVDRRQDRRQDRRHTISTPPRPIPISDPSRPSSTRFHNVRQSAMYGIPPPKLGELAIRQKTPSNKLSTSPHPDDVFGLAGIVKEHSSNKEGSPFGLQRPDSNFSLLGAKGQRNTYQDAATNTPVDLSDKDRRRSYQDASTNTPVELQNFEHVFGQPFKKRHQTFGRTRNVSLPPELTRPPFETPPATGPRSEIRPTRNDEKRRSIKRLVSLTESVNDSFHTPPSIRLGALKDPYTKQSEEETLFVTPPDTAAVQSRSPQAEETSGLLPIDPMSDVVDPSPVASMHSSGLSDAADLLDDEPPDWPANQDHGKLGASTASPGGGPSDPSSSDDDSGENLDKERREDKVSDKGSDKATSPKPEDVVESESEVEEIGAKGDAAPLRPKPTRAEAWADLHRIRKDAEGVLARRSSTSELQLVARLTIAIIIWAEQQPNSDDPGRLQMPHLPEDLTFMYGAIPNLIQLGPPLWLNDDSITLVVKMATSDISDALYMQSSEVDWQIYNDSLWLKMDELDSADIEDQKIQMIRENLENIIAEPEKCGQIVEGTNRLAAIHHVYGNHWTVICIDFRALSVIEFDSRTGEFAEGNERYSYNTMRLFAQVQAMRAGLHILEARWRFSYRIPFEQHNTRDCGIYAAETAIAFMQGHGNLTVAGAQYALASHTYNGRGNDERSYEKQKDENLHWALQRRYAHMQYFANRCLSITNFPRTLSGATPVPASSKRSAPDTVHKAEAATATGAEAVAGAEQDTADNLDSEEESGVDLEGENDPEADTEEDRGDVDVAALLADVEVAKGDFPHHLAGYREILHRLLFDPENLASGLTIAQVTENVAAIALSLGAPVRDDLESLLMNHLLGDDVYFLSYFPEDTQMAGTEDDSAMAAEEPLWKVVCSTRPAVTTERFIELCNRRPVAAQQDNGISYPRSSVTVFIVVKRHSGAIKPKDAHSFAVDTLRAIRSYYQCFGHGASMPTLYDPEEPMDNSWIPMFLPGIRATLTFPQMVNENEEVKLALNRINRYGRKRTSDDRPVVTIIQFCLDGGTVNNESFEQMTHRWPGIHFRIVVGMLASPPRKVPTVKLTDQLIKSFRPACIHPPVQIDKSETHIGRHVIWSAYDVDVLASLFPSQETLPASPSETGETHAAPIAPSVLLAHEQYLFSNDMQRFWRLDCANMFKLPHLKSQCLLGQRLGGHLRTYSSGPGRNAMDLGICIKTSEDGDHGIIDRTCEWCGSDTAELQWDHSYWATSGATSLLGFCCDRVDCKEKEMELREQLSNNYFEGKDEPQQPLTKLQMTKYSQDARKLMASYSDKALLDLKFDFTAPTTIKRRKCGLPHMISVKGAGAFLDQLTHDSQGNYDISYFQHFTPLVPGKARGLRSACEHVAGFLSARGISTDTQTVYDLLMNHAKHHKKLRADGSNADDDVPESKCRIKSANMDLSRKLQALLLNAIHNENGELLQNTLADEEVEALVTAEGSALVPTKVTRALAFIRTHRKAHETDETQSQDAGAGAEDDSLFVPNTRSRTPATSASHADQKSKKTVSSETLKWSKEDDAELVAQMTAGYSAKAIFDSKLLPNHDQEAIVYRMKVLRKRASTVVRQNKRHTPDPEGEDAGDDQADTTKPTAVPGPARRKGVTRAAEWSEKELRDLRVRMAAGQKPLEIYNSKAFPGRSYGAIEFRTGALRKEAAKAAKAPTAKQDAGSVDEGEAAQEPTVTKKEKAKPWSTSEDERLLKEVNAKKGAKAIFESGVLPGRTLLGIRFRIGVKKEEASKAKEGKDTGSTKPDKKRTTEQIQTLLRMQKKNKTIREIQKALPGRTEAAIRSQLWANDKLEAKKKQVAGIKAKTEEASAKDKDSSSSSSGEVVSRAGLPWVKEENDKVLECHEAGMDPKTMEPHIRGRKAYAIEQQLAKLLKALKAEKEKKEKK